jgi:xylan 1,4-beta-xylosidase
MVGSGISQTKRYSYRRTVATGRGLHPATRRVWLRLKNDRNSISGSYSLDGKTWKRDAWGMEVSGFDNNTLGGFMSVLPGIFVCGEGEATFRHLNLCLLIINLSS